jgi:transcriptional regulator with XRE-family HTH domain
MFRISDGNAEKACAQYDKQFRVTYRATHLGNALRAMIKERRISYREIARRSDGRVSPSTISDILKGKNTNPTMEVLQAIARGLGESESDFFNAARGVREPDGFRESRFWELFEAYQRITSEMHRKVVDGAVSDLISMVEALAKTARPAERNKATHAGSEPEALRRAR